MKRELEEAACFFDFHRGWGLSHQTNPYTPYGRYGHWIKWKEEQVALGTDCPYVGHGDGRTLETCHRSCFERSCNLVNFNTQVKGGDCVLRRCSDPAQPSLTGGADGWQVWSMVNETQRQCSPYHAIFRQLNQRYWNRPVNHGSLPQRQSLQISPYKVERLSYNT